jgi:hypothetical protein
MGQFRMIGATGRAPQFNSRPPASGGCHAVAAAAVRGIPRKNIEKSLLILRAGTIMHYAELRVLRGTGTDALPLYQRLPVSVRLCDREPPNFFEEPGHGRGA